MATKTLQSRLGGKKPGKFQSIPQRQSADPVIDAIAENIEQLTGQRGTGGKKSVLWEDLEALGVAGLNNGLPQLRPGFGHGNGSGSGGGNVTPPTVEAPTQPQNVVGKAGFGMATLTWDTATYKGHAYTEIFQGDTDVFSLAIRVGTTPADIFTISTDLDADKYYWIRFVNVLGDRGPINDTNGIHIVSVKDPQYLLDLINSQIPDLDEYITNDELNIELSGYADTDLLDRLDVLLAESALENSTTIDEQISEAKVGTATLRATIKNEYYTIVKADEAIAAAVQTVKSEIEDPNGSSLGATVKNSYVANTTFTQAQAQLKQELQSNINGVDTKLTNDYYTSAKTDEAIAQSKQELTSEIDGVKSNLSNNYLTKVKTNEAIAQASQSLQSNIDGVSSNLSNNYLTKVKTNEAIAQSAQSLQSNIDGVSSNLSNNYLTTTKTNEAIAKASQTLQSSIDGVSSNLSKNYYTKTTTNNQISTAVANASQTLQSSIDGVDSKVSTVSNTVAQNDGKYEALWGVKASVGDAVASIGLVAKRSGSGINDSYFFVKDADFKVLYTDGTTQKQAAIFGTVNDPNNPGKKVLTIDTTYINAANIKDLVTGSIVADSIVAGSEIHTPVLRSPTINQPGSNFYVTSAGIVNTKGANIDGHINATSGDLNDVVIHENCTILGTLSAAKIIGDIVKAYDVNIPEQRWTLVPPGSDHLFLTLNFPAEAWDRQLSLPALYTGSQRTAGRVHLNGAYVDSQSWFGNIGDAMGMIGPKVITLAKNQPHEVKIYLRNLLSNKGTPMIRNQDAIYLTFKD